MSTAIPKGSLVLVTGVNGYIGSHVADQLLEAGYRVRGTTRNIEKVKDLKSLWEQKYGPNKIEFVVVPDMSTPGAFDASITGVSGIVHVASVMSFDVDPNKVIPPVLDGINSILETAAKEPSVKRFVYTSSSAAARSAEANVEYTLDENTWNEEAVKKAWAPPPYEPQRRWAVYGASKTQGEQAMWNFVKEHKPSFVVNSVLPNWNAGKILVKGQYASSCSYILRLYNGEKSQFEGVSPQWFVDVQDDAKLHVAALIDPDVQNERLYAFAEPFVINDLLRIFHKLRPGQKFLDEWTDPEVKDISMVRNERSIELLKKHFGQTGWKSLEESVKNAIESS